MKPSFRNAKKKRKRGAVYYISLLFFIGSVSAFVIYGAFYVKDMHNNERLALEMREARKNLNRENVLPDTQLVVDTPTPVPTDTPTPTATPVPTRDPEDDAPLPNGDPTPTPSASPTPTLSPTPTPTPVPPKVLDYAKNYLSQNPEFVGYLDLIDTNPAIAYPVVMERDYDKEFYLNHDFKGAENRNGTLFTVNNCKVGVGLRANNYLGGEAPTTNILIFGHDMYSNQMFGNLSLYLDQKYYEKHKYIYFDTAYEYRTYEIVAIFRSHEYEDPNDDNFKYYFFYNADTQAEFDYWYNNIKAASEVDCRGTGRFGDQFITLSTCSTTDETGKHNENGRLAVVAVRID
ncbi:MAG: class B sortase [Lachnospiraceae bacterium]|nr:class B sortase [Lachnospiraceae bacterium]